MHLKLGWLVMAIAILTSASARADAESLIVGTRTIGVPGATVMSAPHTVRYAVPQFSAGGSSQMVMESPSEFRILSEPVLISPAHSNFTHRLDMLLDQIRLGEQSGALSQSASAGLRSEYSRLSAAASAVGSGGYAREQDSWLEKQINLLNRDVSDSMNGEMVK